MSSTENGKVRIALIGAGGMANSAHYPSLAECPEAELVGICDLSQARREATAQKFGIPATFADYRQMLDQTRPQAVYALMAPHLLFDVAMDIIERGHDLFIEKPPAVTAFQTECLARAAQERNLITGVGFQRRYHPLFRACHAAVTAGRQLNQVAAIYNKGLPAAAKPPYYRGAVDVLTSDVIHAVDMLRVYAGGEIEQLCCDVRILDCWYPVSFTVLARFDNGVTGTLQANHRAGARRLALELHAPDASAYANADGAAEIYLANGAPQVLDYRQVAGSEASHVCQGFLAQTRAFIAAVKTHTPLPNDLADAVKTMRLIERIRSEGWGGK